MPKPIPMLSLASLFVGATFAAAGPVLPAQEPAIVPAGKKPAPFGADQDMASQANKPSKLDKQPKGTDFVLLRYPEDRGRAVAVVGGVPVTLGELIDHIDERHHPGLRAALDKKPKLPTIHGYLRSDLLAPWVRHYADIRAFRFVAEQADSKIDEKELDAAISAQLKTSFEAWLKNYAAQRSGDGTELSQDTVNQLLTRYQLHNGLAIEVQGWLDYFEPGEYNRLQLRNFFNENARYFGGMVDISHILVQHRDAGTGLLLIDEARGRANEKLADLKLRLRPDGSNFADLARRFSDDTRTARRGGELNGVRRFDDRLPASLCRAAWALKDGEISDVVESQYGWHIIQRRGFNQHVFALFTDDAIPSIEIVMRRARQEAVLFDARARAGVELKL